MKLAPREVDPRTQEIVSGTNRGWAMFLCYGLKDVAGRLVCTCGDPLCSSKGKHPKTAKGYLGAITDSARLFGKLTADRVANIAVRTGLASRNVVLDEDNGPGKFGSESLEQWEATLGKLPPHPIAITGNGFHHYFAYPEDETIDIPCRIGVASGLDVRGNGGYVIAPPSLHSSGRNYAWEASSHPDEVPAPQLPPKWIDALRGMHSEVSSGMRPSKLPPLEHRLARARRYLATKEGAVSGEGGHLQTFKAALCTIRGFSLSYDEVMPLIREFNARCEPPWSEKELRHKVNDAVAKSILPWSYILDREAPQGKAGQVRALTEVFDPETGELMPGSNSASGPGLSNTRGSWEAKLIVNKRDEPLPNTANAATILQYAAGWHDAIYHNAFEGRVCLKKATPAHVGKPDDFPRAWTDCDDIAVATWLQREWQLNVAISTVAQAAVEVGQLHVINPVVDYLNSVVWDGVPRVKTWLQTYLGVEDSPYVQAVGEKFLISAVARALHPGCQVDTVPIFEGKQGTKKTSAIRALSPVQDWYTSELADLTSKDAEQGLMGKWIIEIDELDVILRADSSRGKSFITRMVGHFRPSYGRHTIDQPRRCVFIGSTNSDNYLKDETGNRRYWPIKCGKIDIDGLVAIRDQLWAEAVHLYKAGVRWWLTPEEEEPAKAEQDRRYDVDAWAPKIEEFLRSKTAETLLNSQEYLTTGDILYWAIFLNQDKWGKSEQTRVGNYMRKSTWIRKQFDSKPGRPTGYTKPEGWEFNGKAIRRPRDLIQREEPEE